MKNYTINLDEKDVQELANAFDIEIDELLTQIVRSGLIAFKIKLQDVAMKELRKKGNEINKKLFRNTPFYK